MEILKVLCSGDLHLFDREIGATIGYADESSRNLKKLLNIYLNDDSDFMILGGDIQHGIPDDIREMSKWRSLLIDMREAVFERLKLNNLFNKLRVYDKDDNLLDIANGTVSCLFSVKGNHDYNRRTSRENSFTFFDDLVEANIISVPHRIEYEGTEIHFYNSGDWDKPRKRKDGTDLVIGIYHDAILQPERINTFMGNGMINPAKETFLADVDLGVLNDIHMQIVPYKVNTMREDGFAQETVLITHGSIGRTSFNESHKRDFALLTKLLISADNNVEYEQVEMDLLPYKNLFDYEKVIKVKKRENMFEQFSLEIEKVDTVKGDPRDEIEAMKIDGEVKRVCLEILNEVMNDN